MAVIMFTENLNLLHGIISFPDVTSYGNNGNSKYSKTSKIRTPTANSD